MQTLRVATWNLWWRYGDPETRRPAIDETLRRCQPDIVGLQEVWSQGSISLASELAATLGFHTAFAPALDSAHFQRRGHEDFEVGNAVVSRWPFASTERVPLPAGTERDESRLAVSVVIETPHGTMRFTSAHLNSGWWHNATRTQQLGHLVQWLADQPPTDLPSVLVGDFNAGPDFDELRPLRGRSTPYDNRLALVDAWELANPNDPGATWDRANPHVPGDEPSTRIDYVFVEPARTDGRGRVRSAERIGLAPIAGVVTSDHYGVLAEVQVGADQPST